jgi:hypothetical protein
MTPPLNSAERRLATIRRCRRQFRSHRINYFLACLVHWFKCAWVQCLSEMPEEAEQVGPWPYHYGWNKSRHRQFVVTLDINGIHEEVKSEFQWIRTWAMNRDIHLSRNRDSWMVRLRVNPNQ